MSVKVYLKSKAIRILLGLSVGSIGLALLWTHLVKSPKSQVATSCVPSIQLAAIEQNHQRYLANIKTQEPSIRLDSILKSLNENLAQSEFAYTPVTVLVDTSNELDGKQIGTNTILVSSEFLVPGKFTDDELTALLAHEIYHKINRDIERGACLEGKELAAFQRNTEYDADKRAHLYLAQYGLEPSAMQTLLHKIRDRYPDPPLTENSTHPSIGSRISALEQLIQ